MLQLIPVIEAADLGWIDPETNIAGLYQVNRLSDSELQSVIEDDHLKPVEGERQSIHESCPLFGGVTVLVDGQPKLTPQCCGDLSDINDWFRVGDDAFSAGYICLEGHPKPYVKRLGDILTIVCDDKWEDVAVGTEPEFVIQRGELLEALVSLQTEVDRFRDTIDKFSSRYGVVRLSEILVAVERE